MRPTPSEFYETFATREVAIAAIAITAIALHLILRFAIGAAGSAVLSAAGCARSRYRVPSAVWP